MSFSHVDRYAKRGRGRVRSGFTLIELLVVISIITLLIGVLVPYLSKARTSAKSTICLSRLKEIGTGLGTYAATNQGLLPPAAIDWHPVQQRLMIELGINRCKIPFGFGWAELLYEHIYSTSEIQDRSHFPAQRNFEDKYERYFNCPSGETQVTHAGHFRVYLPGWVSETYGHDELGRMDFGRRGHGRMADLPQMSQLIPRRVLIGEGSENSEAGDYLGDPVPVHCNYVQTNPARETSTIGFVDIGGPVNQANRPWGCGSATKDMPNRFAHRHYGGGNYLFGDFHAERSKKLREELACDYDLAAC